MNRQALSGAAGKIVLDSAAIAAHIDRLSDAILKDFGSRAASLAVVGIQTRGVVLARRVAEQLRKKSGEEIPMGVLDITLYRDDVHAIAEQPEVKETDLPFDIQDRPIILIDDVLYTGRTVRSALNALIDYGRPECIRLAVLIDRGHRELPISADYTGLVLETASEDIVDVNLVGVDEEENVRICPSATIKKNAPAS